MPLGNKFLPVVTKATETVALVNKYNEYNKFAGKSAGFGLVKKEDDNLQHTSPASHSTGFA